MEKWLEVLPMLMLLILLPSTLWAAGLKFAPKFPSRHPYLMMTAEEVDRVQERAQSEAWAREALDRILKRADGVLERPPEIPDGISPDHRGVARAARDAALAYALSGKTPYLDYVRRILLHYAQIYTTFPLVNNGRSRLTASSSLYETGWYIPLVHAFDLVYEGLSADDRQRMESGIIRPGLDCFMVRDYETDPRSTDWHYRCYNFQAWHLAAVGLAGFCLQDGDLIRYAIDSPFGYRHQIGHDIQDDGLFWERSIGYHTFTLSALLHLTEAAWRCGTDLYTMAVPDTIGPSDPVRELNYPVDGDNGPKTLKMMFDAPFYYPFPDGSCAQIGDSGVQQFRGNPYYQIGYARYGDPKYAWLIQHAGYSPDLTTLIHGRIEGAFDRPVLGTGRFANTGRTVLGSTLYPATGYAILRGNELDPESTCVLLNYGPYGGGHGHPDRLNFVLYANGKQWVRDFGSFRYNGHPMALKAEWTAQTVSHSTLVADETSHYPQRDRNSAWPSDNIAHPTAGKLTRFCVDPLLKVARASADRVIEGVRLDRTLALFDGFVVDLFRAEGRAAHQYDWVLHVDGQPDTISASLRPQEGVLGDGCGYQHIVDVESGGAGRTWTAGWRDDAGRGMRVTIAGEAGTRAIRARSMTNRADEFVSTLIARRRAASALFIALFDPYRGSPRVARMRQLTPERSGRTVDGRKAVGIEVLTVDGVRYRLLVSDGSGRFLFGDVSFHGELALEKTSAEGREISVVGARYLADGNRTWMFSEPTDAYLQ